MKRLLILSTVILGLGFTATAQTKTAPMVKPAQKDKVVDSKANMTVTTQTPAPQPVNEVDSKMKFAVEEHDFGVIPEGPAVSFDFEYKNISKEPIILENVQASCGCTTPNWSKEPVLPKKTSKITATYNTQGRPGPFFKTITIKSNAGTKVVKIKGTVEKAPENSVPANDNSMIKH